MNNKITYIRDKAGQIIGQERGNQIQRNGKTLAIFDEKTNLTKSIDGKVVGYGDQRKMVLEKELAKQKKK